jgi:UDP-glucose 4-epimerase
MTKAKVLVWGACGFIGTELTAMLVRQGYRVAVLSRPRSRYAPASWDEVVEWHELEGRDAEEVYRSALAGVEVVFNLAGSSGAVGSNRDPGASLDANCRTQLEFLQACAEYGDRPHIVYPSSRLVYGFTGNAQVTETHPLSPRSVYAAHKLCVENYLQIWAQRDLISYTVCRISNAYGYEASRQNAGYKIINLFVRKALRGEEIVLFGDGGQYRDFIYISDVAEILLRAGFYPSARNEIFNIGSGTSHTMAEAAAMIAKLACRTPVRYTPWPEEYSLVESGDYFADVSKSRRALRLGEATPFACGLEKTIELYRDDIDPHPLPDLFQAQAAGAVQVG